MISNRHWLIVVFFILIYGIPMARILRRTGHSRWWVIPFFLPLLNLIAIWVLAFVDWPMVKEPPKPV